MGTDSGVCFLCLYTEGNLSCVGHSPTELLTINKVYLFIIPNKGQNTG